MKKFTLLVAFLVCAVSFGQRADRPLTSVQATAKAAISKIAKVTANQGVSEGQSSFTSFDTSGIVADRAAEEAVRQDRLSHSTNPVVQELLDRLASVSNSAGSLSDHFTTTEVNILRAHFAGRDLLPLESTATGPSNFKSNTGQVGSPIVNGPAGSASRALEGGNFQFMPVTITHSVSQTISPGDWITCNTGGIATDNQFFRDFDLDDDFGITGDFEVTHAEFGVDVISGAFDVDVNIYSYSGAFPSGFPGSATLQGSASVTIGAGDAGTIVSVPVSATIPFGENLIYEIQIFSDGITQFGLGCNLDGQTGPSWIQAADCGATAPTDLLAAFGLSNAFIMNIVGDLAGGGGGGDPTAIGVNNATGNFINFDPAAPEVLNAVGTSPSANFEGAGCVDPSDPNNAYAMDVSGELYQIDVAAGTYTSLGFVSQPGAETCSGMEIDPTTGTLYLLTTDVATSTLSTVDLGTLDRTTVGVTGMAGGIALAIDGTGQGWSYDIVDDSFYSVDLATGAATLVGSLGFDANFGQGMCYDANTGQVYLSAFNNGTFVGEWRTVDPATGNTTLVGVLGETTPGGLNQVGWSAVPDVSGGGGGGGCTTGVFTARPDFEGAFDGTLTDEDFASTLGVDICSDVVPISSAGNACFAPGDVVVGPEVFSDPTGEAVTLQAGGPFGNTANLVGANAFADATTLSFPAGDVDAFGADIYSPLAAAPVDVLVEAFGASGLLESVTVTVPASATSGAFVGIIADEPILLVYFTAANDEGELIADLSFGTCGTGGGGGGCGDFSYVNESPTGSGPPSQIFPDFPDFDCQAVDDVVFDGTDAGEICSIAITGAYSAGAAGLPGNAANTVELVIFSDNAGQPGSAIYSESFPNTVDADGDGSFVLEPTGAPTLNPNTTYWIQVQANMQFGDSGQWFWSSANDGNDAAALWQNPAGGFGNPCTTWGTFADCGVGGGEGPDLLMEVEMISVEIITYDDCEGALPIACGEAWLGSTIDATDDSAVAPDCDTPTTTPGVWYKYEDTSGLAANVTLTTCSANTDYDTKISVYTGECSNPPLTCVAGNDDDPNCTNFQSTVEFTTDGSATTYYILVHGFGGQTGNFELQMSCEFIPPPNDDIENAIDLDEVGCPFTDENVAMPAATTEGGNPTNCDISGANGVWYVFTPELNGQITGTIASPAGFSSVTFYTAPDESSVEDELILVDWYQNQCLPSTSATIPVVAGQSYYCFVVNSGGITDIIFDNCQLGTASNEIEGFAFYPNPTNDKLNLSASQNIENVALYNILGQRVIDMNVEATQTQVSVAHLAAGAYIMEVTVDGQKGTYKVIKN